jgi:hypothetical protein
MDLLNLIAHIFAAAGARAQPGSGADMDGDDNNGGAGGHRFG